MRQEEVDQVRRVQKSRLEIAEERPAGKDVGVPEREVSARHLSEAEDPPGQVLQEHVAARASQHHGVALTERARERDKDDGEENRRSGQLGEKVRSRAAQRALQMRAAMGARSPTGRPATSRSARATSTRAMRLRQAYERSALSRGLAGL
jgi:hypothetical protein